MMLFRMAASTPMGACAGPRMSMVSGPSSKVGSGSESCCVVVGSPLLGLFTELTVEVESPLVPLRELR
jgi:hypothetical protein